MHDVTGSYYAARLLMCRTISLSKLNSYCLQRETSLKKTTLSCFYFALPVRGANFKKKKTILYAPLAQLVEQLTLNLTLGIMFVLITLDVFIAGTISSPANIHFVYARV